ARPWSGSTPPPGHPWPRSTRPPSTCERGPSGSVISRRSAGSARRPAVAVAAPVPRLVPVAVAVARGRHRTGGLPGTGQDPLARGELAEHGVGRTRDAGGGRGDAGGARQVADVALLLRGHQGHHGALAAGPRGAARAVQVGLVLGGRVG